MYGDMVKGMMDPQKFELVRKAIAGAHPDIGASLPSDEHVGDFVASTFWTLPSVPQQAKTTLGIPDAPPGWKSTLGYYLTHTRHHRLDAPHSDFVGTLPMVRVPLPQQPPTGIIAQTPMGEVRVDDHLIFSIDGYTSKQGLPPGSVARVELITPPRANKVRFAAISFLLGYRNANDTTPSHYILEAGLAQGGSRVTYIAPDFSAPITRICDYKPTPFADAKHYYVGRLFMDPAAPNEPLRLVVSVWTDDPSKATASIYLSLTCDLKKHGAPLDVDSARIYRDAVIRVAAIAKAKNLTIPDMPDFVRDILAKDAVDNLPWLHKPV